MTRPLSYIDRQEQLAPAVERLHAQCKDALPAFDTEADSLYRYKERLCLLQLSSQEEDFIFDPLALDDLSPLWTFLQTQGALLHSAEYDLSLLQRSHNVRLPSLFDTSVAAWLLGHGQLSLATLVETYVGVVLEKSHQKDDWGQRPLPNSMILYARDDTRYLHALQAALTQALQQQNMMDAAEEEFALLANKEYREIAFDPEGFRKIKGAQLLDEKQSGILAALYLWRDSEARRRDQPPFRVLQNEFLLLLAEHAPKTILELSQLKRFPESLRNRYGAQLCACIASARPYRAPRTPHRPPAMEPAARDRLDKLKTWREETAKNLSWPIPLVANNAALEALAIHRPQSSKEMEQLPDLRRWRCKRFGEDWQKLLNALP